MSNDDLKPGYRYSPTCDGNEDNYATDELIRRAVVYMEQNGVHRCVYSLHTRRFYEDVCKLVVKEANGPLKWLNFYKNIS